MQRLAMSAANLSRKLISNVVQDVILLSGHKISAETQPLGVLAVDLTIVVINCCVTSFVYVNYVIGQLFRN